MTQRAFSAKISQILENFTHTERETAPIIDVAELEKEVAGHKTALICRGAEELKAEDITVLDVRKQTILADFFVLVTGTSNTHVRSIAGHVQDKLRAEGIRARFEGEASSLWMVADYGDVILHVLGEETREFYDLERLWADAKLAKWPESVPVV